MSEYRFQAYCDICKEAPYGWVTDYQTAMDDREEHFKNEHPDNPMVKQNCRIQRRTVE